MSSNGLLITHSNIHKLTQADILTFSSKEYWHKFLIENGGRFDKDKVLLSILDSINPFDLVPVQFTVTGNDAYFLARNCGQAIEKLCLNLLLPIQLRDNVGQVILSINTCHIPIELLKINMQLHLKNAIERRYNKSKEGFINLSFFHKEPELYEILFCPLSKPRFLLYVLSILKRILPVTSINLSNNEIENVKPLEVLKEFDSLTSLDLSFNKIKNLDSVELSKAMPLLKEINLRGNPICNTFKSEVEYVKWIKDKFPKIEKIDEISINYGIPNQQVWLCNKETFSIVDQFLKHFFTFYDGKRVRLSRCYETTATLSFMSDNLPTEELKKFNICYQYQGKNYWKPNDQTKIIRVFCYKKKNVRKLLVKLPLTRHDPYTFKVDVLHYQKAIIVLMVSGIYEEINIPPKICSFTRTFVLRKVSRNEYKISNDLYHIRSATNDEIKSSCFQSFSENYQKI